MTLAQVTAFCVVSLNVSSLLVTKQKLCLMLPNCDTFSFHLVCFIIAQEIYTCLESFLKRTLLKLQRKTVVKSKSKSELPVKHSFGPCVCMKHVWNTCIHTIWPKCLWPHLVCRTGLCTFCERFALFSFHVIVVV